MNILISLLALVLTLSVSPNVGYAPLKVNIKVHHPYQKGDQTLQIGIFCSGDLISESDRPLGPENPPIYTLPVTLSDPCDYLIVAQVVKRDGKMDYQTKQLQVR